MKNLLILAIFGAVGYAAWYILTRPIGAISEVEDTSVESDVVEPMATKTASVSPKTEVEKYTPIAKKKSSFLTHRYDYSTQSNLKVEALKSAALAQKMAGKPKKYTYRGSRAPKGWQTKFYNLFLNAPEDKNVLVDMVTQFERQAKQLKVTPVELAIAYVQGGIAYDTEKASLNEFLLQYPYETIYKCKGVCADKTILLSKLLTLMDYKHVLFEFPKAQHMALGLKVPSKYDDFNSGYAFVETTNYTAIGEIPQNYVQGFRINEQPKLIYPNQNGKRTFIQMGTYKKKEQQLEKEYGEAYKHGTTRQKKIAIDMKALEKKLTKLEAEHDRRRCGARTRKSDSEMKICIKLTNDINDTVAKYNALVKKFNASR